MSRFSPSRVHGRDHCGLIAAGALVLAGCGGDDDDSSSTATTPGGDDGRTRCGRDTERCARSRPPTSASTCRSRSRPDAPRSCSRTPAPRHTRPRSCASPTARPASSSSATRGRLRLGRGVRHVRRGPNQAVPAGSNSVVVTSNPATTSCWPIPSPADGTPHVIKGMQAPLQVRRSRRRDTQCNGRRRRADVDAEGLLLRPPRRLRRRPAAVVNNGSQNHEVVIVGLPDGVEIADVVESTVPIFTPGQGPGALHGMSPGRRRSLRAGPRSWTRSCRPVATRRCVPPRHDEPDDRPLAQRHGHRVHRF